MASYTALSLNTVQHILKNYDIGNFSSYVELNGGLANSSVIVTTSRGKFVLCVCDEKNESEVKVHTHLLAHLKRYHFSCSSVMATKLGNAYCLFEGKPVYIKKYIDGTVESKLSIEQSYQVGLTLACLHAIPSPPFVSQHFAMTIDEMTTTIDHDTSFGRWLVNKSDFIAPYLSDTLPKGLIHGDLFWDNLLFNENRVAAVLDFEEACRSFLVFDIGMTIVGCCSRNEQINQALAQSLINGYETQRKMTNEERQSLRAFTVYAATVTSFWRYRQFNIIHPNSDKKDAYVEMSRLADWLEQNELSGMNFSKKMCNKK
jgi:homoserine kinase type II